RQSSARAHTGPAEGPVSATRGACSPDVAVSCSLPTGDKAASHASVEIGGRMTTVLITGASTGFGRHAAEAFARRGYRVFATIRDPRGRNDEARRALEALPEAQHPPLGGPGVDRT